MANYSFAYVWNRLLKKIRGKAIRNSLIAKSTRIESGSQIIDSTIGKYSFCGYDCKILNCTIGNFCSLADNVIIGGARHPYEWVSTSPVFYKGRDSIKKKFSEFDRSQEPRTFIGSDVWIGEGVYIKAGITVGHGSVIGMGSVVTKDILPYSIVGGVPAKVIKSRFPDDICEWMLKIQWWDFSDQKLEKYASCFSDPIEFIQRIQSEKF